MGTIVVIVGFTLLGPLARSFNQRDREKTRALQTTLPGVGSEGTLTRTDGPPMLCAPPTHAGYWSWPCGASEKRAITNGAHVRVMKAAVNAGDALCRYWVKSGPDDGASGDAPCEWFHAEPGTR